MTMAAILMTGCATPVAPLTPVFFPPPPAEPRIQYLTSFSSSEDIEHQSSFLRFLVGPPPPRDPIVKPYGITVAQDRIYICDTILGRIHVIDLKNKAFRDFSPGRGCNIRKPVNVAVDDSGTLYIADTILGQIVICAADGTYWGTIGEKGASRLTDVAIQGDRLYVTDMQKSKVDVYDKTTLKPIAVIPSNPSNNVERLLKPTNIAVDSRRHVYVSDAGTFRVQEYDAEGRYVRSIGQHGDAPGEFARPKGVALDRAGRLYVADAVSSVVQLFDPEGNLLLFFGEAGSGPGQLSLPAGVTVDYNNVDMFRKYIAPDFDAEYIILVASQYGIQKINVYGFGHRKQP